MSKESKEFNVTLLDKSGSKNVAKTTGDADLKIENFKTYEYVGTYPYFEMVLYGFTFDSLLGEKDFIISFASEYYNYKVKVCILNKEIRWSDNKIVVKGKFAKSDLVLQANTVYLGSTAKKAIQTLGFEQKIKTKNNVNTKFHQRAETPIQVLEKICDCEADFPFWCIGINDLILTTSSEKKDFISLSKIHALEENSVPKIKTVQSDVEGIYYSMLGNSKYIIGTKDNYESLKQAAINQYIREHYKPNTVMTGVFNGPFPYPVGTKMKNIFKNMTHISFWSVISVKITVVGGNAVSLVQYAYWEDMEG